MKNSQTLQLEIAQTLEQLRIKKAELKKVQAIEEANAPMRDSKMGKAYLSTVRGVTGWFAEVNRRANMLLEQPEQYRSEVLLHKADALLELAKSIENREHKKAGRIAVQCAEMVMLIENLQEQHDLILKSELEQICVRLDFEVQRLRPVLDEKKEEKLAKLLENMEVLGLASTQE